MTLTPKVCGVLWWRREQNLQCLTLQQLRERRKTLHLSMTRNLIAVSAVCGFVCAREDERMGWILLCFARVREWV